jgi:hypothetical protein
MTIHRISPKLQSIYDHQFPDDGVTITLVVSDNPGSDASYTLTGVKGDVTKTVAIPSGPLAWIMASISTYMTTLHTEFNA